MSEKNQDIIEKNQEIIEKNQEMEVEFKKIKTQNEARNELEKSQEQKMNNMEIELFGNFKTF
jgi:hypothetical protein